MKSFIKKMMLLAIVMSFVASCGNNSSGGSFTGNHAGPDLPGGGLTAQSGQNVKSIEELRKIFDAKKMNEAIQPGMPIFHVGPAFSGGLTGGGFQFETQFCAQILIWSWGDCLTQQEVYQQQQLNYVNQSLSSGRFNVIQAADLNLVRVDQVLEFFGLELSTDNARVEVKVYDRDAVPYYNEMLAKGQNNFFGGASNIKVTSAKVTMENGQTIEAYLVENLSNSFGANKKFIVSPQLAIIANPVAVIETDGWGRSYATGALKSVGGVKVKSIQATTSILGQNGQVIQGQQINI